MRRDETDDVGRVRLTERLYDQLHTPTAQPPRPARPRSPFLRLTFRNALTLLALLIVLGIGLSLGGYGPDTRLGAVIISLFSATLLGVVLSGSASLDIGWLKATGGIAVFFGIYLLIRPEESKDSLALIVRESNVKLSAWVRDESKSYNKLVDAMAEQRRTHAAIGAQRAELADFMSLS